MQREDQVFAKVPAPAMEGQGHYAGEEKDVSELKKRNVLFPVHVDLIK